VSWRANYEVFSLRVADADFVKVPFLSLSDAMAHQTSTPVRRQAPKQTCPGSILPL